MKRYFLILIMILFVNYSFSQTKNIQAVRVSQAPKIDGNPNDDVWQKANIAKDFVMFEPGDGNPEKKGYETQVKLLYDDTALYILAICNDPNPNNIGKEFGLRDQWVQADYFAVVINPFFAPGGTYLFGVTAAGAQMDGIQKERTDWSWNAVWKSAVSMTKDAWYVEMKIPYSALRFQNQDKQNWAIGFTRFMNNTKETYSWTHIDKKKSGDLVQFLGVLKDIEKIKPPVRLSLYPYISIVHTRFQGDKKTGVGYGMDLKYGLNESYTLDATLIPDFSDTPYDNIELNLGPFEQRYSEKRQFFTEGVNLFNKARLFYSRRIGGTPSNKYEVYNQLDQDEDIVDNPDNIKLINAIKISGRSKNGLGIGFLNAITNKAEATIINNNTGKTRKFTTEPYANYNVFVMDYAFNKSSSISLINTNVIRQGNARDADVVAIDYNLLTQKNTLKIGGAFAESFINENNNWNKGFKFISHISKQINEHKFWFLGRIYDDKFDNNDLGYLRRNNLANFDFGYNYSILKPTKHFNRFKAGIGVGFDHLYKNLTKVQRDIEINMFATNKNYLSFGGSLEYTTDQYDYYEPRVEGRYFVNGAYGGGSAFLSTDYRKKFAFDLKLSRFSKIKGNQNFYGITFSPRLKVSNRLRLNYSINFNKMNNFKGYVTENRDDIIFGNRVQKVVSQNLGGNYYFNTKAGLNLNFRYYWSPVHYTQYYSLTENGNLETTDYTGNNDINFNIWNLDLSYIWEFAPGSQLTLLYRNNISNIDNLSLLDYKTNVDNLFNEPQKHSFIVKMTYYIDYNTVKNKWF